MAFFKIPDTFWEIFTAVTGGSTTNLTSAIEAIAQAERTKANSYFTNVLDQIPFNTDDYTRIRNFLKDWYATHRTIANLSSQIQDPRSMANSQLDELFRSFGFNYSASLRQASNEPLDNKINFFLDLVNLYKIKGTPRSLLEILQYYGVPQVDIYSFWLRLNQSGELEFQGNAVAGTTVDPSPLTVEYDVLTSIDPHWLYTADQIKNLHQNNLINLPSKSPYIGILPVAEVGSETSILSRKIQDQYFDWQSSGDLPPQDAEINILGETASLLELYLAMIYTYYKEYSVSGTDNTSFICYDGTNTAAADIIAEYDSIVNSRITTRTQYSEKLSQYYDLFTRSKPRNFLQVKSSAETILQTLNPDLIVALDNIGDPILTVLNSLTKDLANWVRNNIGYGYINIGFMLGGLSAFFSDLQPVINFFKPYRARVLTIEAIVLKNRLFNRIIVEDQFSYDTEFEFRDYWTGNGSACCCNPDAGITSDTTAAIACTDGAGDFYSRATFDCGSYFDIGAVTDFREEFQIWDDEEFLDALRCPIDSTGFVYSEMLTATYTGTAVVRIELAGSLSSFTYEEAETDTNYALLADVYTDEPTATADLFDYTLLEKNTYGGRIKLSEQTNESRYYASYKRVRTSNSGSETVSNGASSKTVSYTALDLDTLDEINFQSYYDSGVNQCRAITVDSTGNLIAYMGTGVSGPFYFKQFSGLSSNEIRSEPQSICGYPWTSTLGYQIGGIMWINNRIGAIVNQNSGASWYNMNYVEFDLDGTVYVNVSLSTFDSVPTWYYNKPQAKGIAYDADNNYLVVLFSQVSTAVAYRMLYDYDTQAFVGEPIRCRYPNNTDMQISTVRGMFIDDGKLYISKQYTGGDSLYHLYGWDYLSATLTPVVDFIVDEEDLAPEDGMDLVKISDGRLPQYNDVIVSMNYHHGSPYDLNIVDFYATEKPILANLANYTDSPSAVNTYQTMITSYNYLSGDFEVSFSDAVNTGNYMLEWEVLDEADSGIETIAAGAEGATIEFTTVQDNKYYAVFVDLINVTDSTAQFLSYIVTEKTRTGFYVKFSSPTPTANYSISWAIVPQEVEFDNYTYFQSGEFRPFDENAKYDCTHGFDRIEIEFATIGYFLLTEGGGYLEQENNSRIKLQSSP